MLKSLEIVDKLLEKINQYDDWFLTEVEAEQIKADLEVLEILKKYLGYNIFIRYLVTSHIGIDEYKKVMKFLEEK